MTGPEDMKYRLGGLWFTSQDAIADHCRKIIKETSVNSYQRGKVDESYSPFLLDLLLRHPNYEEKWGSGVDFFVVDQKRGGLQFVRKDGSFSIFSFLKCARGKEGTLKQLFSRAARWAVRGSIVAFRNEMFIDSLAVPSAISGQLVRVEDCHIDHADPPFRQILDEFCETHDWAGMELVDQTFGKAFAHEEDAKTFCKFHDARAVLQVVTAKENMAKR